MKAFGTIIIACVLGFALMASGCGKKKESESEGKKGPAAAKSSGITKEDIAKWDCSKACDTQLECYKKGGMVKIQPDFKKNCMMGCKAMKSNFNPKLAKSYEAFSTYAHGKCK
ncbi:hypothetical protein KKF84_12380 [Myxococcota bacterium]|nr:hypothetical protein [Myxococcota bacterium]